MLMCCAAPVAVQPAARTVQDVAPAEEPPTLAVIKAQHMIEVCNKEPAGAECYSLAIAYYTGQTQTPVSLMERVRDGSTECAKRCVADLGLHAFGWTREEALARTKLSAQAMDSLIAWPGEALGCLDSHAKNEKNPLLGD